MDPVIVDVVEQKRLNEAREAGISVARCSNPLSSPERLPSPGYPTLELPCWQRWRCS
jgi:hypothetical protein